MTTARLKELQIVGKNGKVIDTIKIPIDMSKGKMALNFIYNNKKNQIKLEKSYKSRYFWNNRKHNSC